MRLGVIACFLDEETCLPAFLESVAAQTRAPDRLLLVDDGSADGSLGLAREYAATHANTVVLSRPRRPPQRDRLATAAELEAFSWAVEQLDIDWEVVAKLDADLCLSPDMFAELERRLEVDPGLGIVGAVQGLRLADGSVVRERCPPNHVRGSTKFYRRACFEQVYPLSFLLGWDTTDEVRARMSGWRTGSFEMPAGDPVLMRATATRDGVLRGYRRNGVAAYAYGASFRWVLLGALARMREEPRVFGGLSVVQGWLTALLRSHPRADPEQRAFIAAEHRSRIRAALLGRASRRRAAGVEPTASG
ncbi:MAG TPA: glycosyltransferase family A protein [Solirubrobacteraceae bacterium]|nr:glycosyltransferase family A protein [Solirubrobacteraceae bacterium]